MRPKVGLRQLKDGYPKPTVRQGRMIGDGRTLRWQAPTPKADLSLARASVLCSFFSHDGQAL